MDEDSRNDRRQKALDTLRSMLEQDPLPSVVKTVADAFEAHGIHIVLAAVKQGDPTPLVENRIRQEDVAGIGVAMLGNKLGSFLTMSAKPRKRGPRT